MVWNDERIELLKKMWAEGHSCSRIAARLGGVTRNAVIGKVHRLGLSGRKTLARKQETRPRRHSNGMRAFAPRRLWPNARPSVPREPYTPPPAPVIPPHARKALVTLTEACCRWPIGDPKEPDFGFCPGKKVSGLPYCADHAAIAYRMRPPRPPKVRLFVHGVARDGEALAEAIAKKTTAELTTVGG